MHYNWKRFFHGRLFFGSLAMVAGLAFSATNSHAMFARGTRAISGIRKVPLTLPLRARQFNPNTLSFKKVLNGLNPAAATCIGMSQGVSAAPVKTFFTGKSSLSDSRRVVLADKETMSLQLKNVITTEHLFDRYASYLLQHAGTTKTATGLANLFIYANLAFTEATPDQNQMTWSAMDKMVPELIRALAPGKAELAEEAIRFYRQVRELDSED